MLIFCTLMSCGEVILAETQGTQRGIASVKVRKRGGDAVDWRQCVPGDDTFRALVKAARKHCAT